MSPTEKKTFVLSPSTNVWVEPVEVTAFFTLSHRGASGEFWKHCSQPAQPAGCAKPAVGHGVGWGKAPGDGAHGSTGSPRSAKTQRGYALLLMLVMLTMGILFTVVSQLSLVGMKWDRAQSSTVALNQAKEALLGYAITYRDTHSGNVFGYLPCPDADGDGDADTDTNDETKCASSSKVVVGLLPYKTLALSDLRDASGECLWYAVSPGYKAGLNKVEPMNWDSRGQIRILDNDDITMLADPVNGTEGGAVAVIFAGGPPLSSTINTAGRGNDSNKTCGHNGKANWKAFLESAVFDTAGNSTDNPLIVTKGAIDSTTNNDQIVWITPKDIFGRVAARSDFAAYINSGINKIQGVLNNAISSHPPSTGNNLPTTNPFSGGTSDNNFYDNWKNNFRYLTCATNTYCYDIESQSCDGVLLFSGQSTTGAPRAVIAPATAPALGAYFEDVSSAKALSLVSGTTTDYSGGALAYFDSNRSSDVVRCLTPQIVTSVSFASNILQFSQTESESGMVTPSPTNYRVRLGVSAGATGFGCFWYPSVLPMKDGIRVYFEFNLRNLSPLTNVGSFTFAIADATTNPTPTAMCGASGEDLGYAGNNNTIAPVNYPKVGIEFDKIINSGRNDPAGDHAAFVYWGNHSDNDTTLGDDNFHGAGGGTDPINPVSGSGIIQKPISVGMTYYVRLDIKRIYTASTYSGIYTLNAYITASSPAGCPISPTYFSNLSDDLSTLCPSPAFDDTQLNYGHLMDTITINDVSGSAAMKQVYVGFTTGQEGQNQRVNITNFSAAGQ